MPPPPRRLTINRVGCWAKAILLACGLLVAHAQGIADDTPTREFLPFSKAVDLALEHSGIMGIATLSQWRSQKVYQELRNNYIPQLTVGSGLGYAYGFPLTLEGTAPSLANFTSTQALYNPALKQFIKAAKIDWGATSQDVQDKRDAVILDTALTYAQLEQLSGKIEALTEAQAAAEKGQFVSEQRLQQGVDSKLEVTRSQLTAARIRLRLAEAQGQMDVLRDHLSKLTGLPANSITVEPGSMPQLPQISQDDDLSARAVASSPLVTQADQKVAAAEARAKGEHKAATWPTVDIAAQYAYLARYNNWETYFRTGTFLVNNFTGGLNIRIPVFNSVQKAKAEQADADAMMARKQADLTRNQVGENALKVQRSLRQLAAARDVAKLEWEVAQGELDGVTGRMETGGANTRDQANARLAVDDKHAAYLDVEFELCRAELQLLRLAGELENWAIPPH
jgi:outer membrane protein TolC